MTDEIKSKIEEIEDAPDGICPKDTPRGKALGEYFYNLGLAVGELADEAYNLAVELLETWKVKA